MTSVKLGVRESCQAVLPTEGRIRGADNGAKHCLQSEASRCCLHDVQPHRLSGFVKAVGSAKRPALQSTYLKYMNVFPQDQVSEHRTNVQSIAPSFNLRTHLTIF